MSRIFLHYVLPLLLPAALYLLWLWAARRRGKADADPGEWLWVLVTGIVLMVAVLVLTALTGGGDPSGIYQPPRYEDGRIVPGKIIYPPR